MKKTFFKKIIASSFISLFLLQILYFAIEPTIVVAQDAVDTGGVDVTLNVTAGITISGGGVATMLPNISMTNDRALGSSSWTVSTNNQQGYDLAVVASTTPALTSAGASDNFIDYTEATSGVPETWLSPAVGAKEFGFTVYGADANSLVKYGSPANCGTAAAPSGKYEGFSYTTPMIIASSSVFTPVAGNVTNICFAAQQNQVYAKSGAYTATITATATTK